MQIKDGLYILPTDEQARAQGCYVDLTLPKKIQAFCSKFCVLTSDDFSGKAGRPLSLLPWQQALINTLYGWRKQDGTLRFSRCFCYLPRRQGKSVLVSALSVFTALTQQRAEVYILASTQKQAGVVFDRARDFIASSPALAKRLWSRPHIKQIDEKVKGKGQGSKITILSSEKHGKSGTASSLVVGDEFCEWPNYSARTVYDRLYDSGADRPNSLQIFISTPQFDWSHIGREKYLDCKRILDGDSEDTTTLPIIYEAPDNWREDLPKALEVCCPSLNLTVPLSYYLGQWQAIEGKPLEEFRFETMCMGRWVGSPEQWLPSSMWASCTSRQPESKLYGKPAIIGIDYARRYDLCAYVVVVEDNGIYWVLPRFFIPREVAQQKVEQDNVPYVGWSTDRNNCLYLTDGNVVDPAFMRERIKADSALFRIQEVRFDPYGMEESRQVLEADGYTCVQVSQTITMMSPGFSRIESLVREQKLRHPDNPILNWNVQNCRPKINKDDRLMVEKISDIQRIDGVDAMAIALTYWLEQKEPDPTVLPEGQQWAAIW